MNFLGDYKLSKMMSMNQEKECMEFMDAAEIFESMKEAGENPHDLGEMENQLKTIMTVTEKEIIYRMPIPEGVPQDEIEKAEKAGMIVDGMVLLEKSKCKFEDGALFMYDRSKFLAGTEWVKISTDVEGELNLVMALWKRV